LKATIAQASSRIGPHIIAISKAAAWFNETVGVLRGVL